LVQADKRLDEIPLKSLTENSMVAHALPVIPAKAGIQGAEIGAPALDPRFRGGDDKCL
jgi:hypothetical protein